MHEAPAEPSWIGLLRAECDRTQSQPIVANRIGYSTTVVNQVLKGTYKGDLNRIQMAVEGALGGATVECPVIGEIPRQRCIENQRSSFRATNPTAVRLHRSCPTCPNGGKK